MDNFKEKLDSMLDDPKSSERLKEIIEALEFERPSAAEEEIQSLVSLYPAINEMRENDETIRLLNALKPFVGEESVKRLDKAAQLVQLLKLMPIIRNGGEVE